MFAMDLLELGSFSRYFPGGVLTTNINYLPALTCSDGVVGDEGGRRRNDRRHSRIHVKLATLQPEGQKAISLPQRQCRFQAFPQNDPLHTGNLSTPPVGAMGITDNHVLLCLV